MKNILILADDPLVKGFLQWADKKRAINNKYLVVSLEKNILPKNSNIFTQIFIDPTSYNKLFNIVDNENFTIAFIIMKNIDDTNFVLKNILSIDDKIRIVLLDKWGLEYNQKEYKSNITVLNINDTIGSHLYHYLPNVPLVAQNIGLGKGEIMEILVPYGSSFSYRHIGSIAQRKWKIVALYRDQKQLIPTNATMIRPNDTLIVIGRPVVLDEVYKIINKRKELFPEPFGKNIYLLLDFNFDQEKAIQYLSEAIYLSKQLKNKYLKIRIINATNFKLMDDIKKHRSDNIEINISYGKRDFISIIEYDLYISNIGIILVSIDSFIKDNLKNSIYQLKKIVYLFGDILLYNLTDSFVIASDNSSQMESVSSTVFDISNTLSIKLHLCDYAPDGDFSKRYMIIEHYETLSQIFNTKIVIEKKIVNPIRELEEKGGIIQIVAFEKNMKNSIFSKIFSTNIKDYILHSKKYPKLLVPTEKVLD